MNDSAASFRWSNFSHLYIEHGAADYPLTRLIRDRFAKARVVEIDDYKAVLPVRGSGSRRRKRA